MRKIDALRLKFGDVIEFAETARSYGLPTMMGAVRELTPRGGIRVRDLCSGVLSWVPYHHAIRRIRRAAEPITETERMYASGLQAW